MHELGWAVKETLRLRPPLLLMTRRVREGLDLAGFRIDPGTLVVTSPAITHRAPERFADPGRFDPARFAPGREEDRKNPAALVPLGPGGLAHPGVALTDALQRAVWSHVLRSFDLELLEPRYAPAPRLAIAAPRSPCRVRYRRRRTGRIPPARPSSADPHDDEHPGRSRAPGCSSS